MAYVYKTRKHENKKLTATIAVMGGIILPFTLLLALTLNSVFAGFFKDALSIASVKGAIAKRGFPFDGWMLLFSFVYLLGIIMFLTWYDRRRREDPLGRGFIISKDKPYGQAHFAEPEEYIQNALVDTIEDACGPILGKIDDNDSIINLRMDDKYRFNHNIIVAGISGSGKTFGFVKPYLYQAIRRRESVIIPDPDGGLREDTQALAQRMGMVTRVIDLVDINKSNGWNCLASVKGDNIIQKAQIFADTVVKSGMGGENANSIFISAPKSLLVALILRVMLGTDYKPEQKHIGTVFDLLHNENASSYYDKTLFNKALLQQNNCMAARKPYLAFKHASQNLSGNIITHLANQMGALQDELLAEVLSTDDIDLELPGKVPCVYYCIFPDSDDNYTFISSLFFSMLFTTLMRYADHSPGRHLPVPVNFLLDEFPQYFIPSFDKKMNVVRKRQIRVAIIVQSFGQLEDMYSKKADAIYNACSTVIFRGTNDEKTAKKIADRCGDASVVVETRRGNSSFWGIRRPASSEGTGKRELLGATDAQEIDIDNTLLILQTQQPVLCHVFGHTEHPMSRYATILPKDKLPDFWDERARTAEKIREQRRIVDFYERHPECMEANLDRSYSYQSGKAAEIMKENEDFITRYINARKAAVVEDEEDEDPDIELYDDYADVTEEDLKPDPQVLDKMAKYFHVDNFGNIGAHPIMPWQEGAYVPASKNSSQDDGDDNDDEGDDDLNTRRPKNGGQNKGYQPPQNLGGGQEEPSKPQPDQSNQPIKQQGQKSGGFNVDKGSAGTAMPQKRKKDQ